MKTGYNIVTCVIACVFVIYSICTTMKKKTQAYQKDDGSKYDRIHIYLFWGIIVLAVLVRLYQFGSFPFLNQDSASAAIDAKSLWKYGTDHYGTRFPVHFNAWGHSQMSTLMSYMMIPFFAFFGYSEITIRMPILIMSMAGIVGVYWIARDLLGKRAGIIAMILVAFNPWHFTQSRWALDANLFPHFAIIALALLIHGIYRRKTGLIYFSMIFWGLTHYCYGISLYTIPVILLISCIYLTRKKYINVKTIIISIIVYLAVAWPFFVCMILNTFNLPTIHTPIFTIENFPESRRAYDILFFAPHKGAQLLTNLKAVINVLILQKMDFLWDGVDKFGHMGWCVTPFAISGIYALIRKIRENTQEAFGFVLIAIFALTGFLSGIVTANVDANRINLFMYAFMLLILLGIDMLLQINRKSAVALLAMYAGMFLLFYHSYYTSYQEEFKTPWSFNYNFQCALNAVEEKKYDVIYITPDGQAENTGDVSEIDTIYVYDLDVAYILGKGDESIGQTAYKDKFRYIRASELETIDKSSNIAYISNVEDEALFDEEYFEKQNFGQFIVAFAK